MHRLKEMVQVPHIAIKRFFDDQYTYHASALAYTTLLAIVPLLLVIVFFTSAFPFFTSTVLLGENYILQNFVPHSATSIESYFQMFIHQATRLPMLNIVFLFVTSILLVDTIEETLNDIWQVPKRKRTKKVIAVLVHWILFLLVPLIIGLSVLLTSYVFFVTWITDTSDKSQITVLFLFFLPILINTLVFGIIYIIVPNVTVKWYDGLLGGFIAAIMFEIARIGFAYYVQQFPSYAMIYGAFAIIPLFLLWLYIFWFIILFAALVTHTWVKQRKHHHHPHHS